MYLLLSFFFAFFFGFFVADFRGAVYHTGEWPHEGVDFSGLRVGVVGTGSSAIQAIPMIAQQAERLTVFQRTPNYVVPAQNRPIEPVELRDMKAHYGELRAQARATATGNPFEVNPQSALALTVAEPQLEFRNWKSRILERFRRKVPLDDNATAHSRGYPRDLPGGS